MPEWVCGRGKAARIIEKSGALKQSPLVLLDIGARGNIDPRWSALGSSLQVYGFDAAIEVVPQNPRQHFFKMAIGERDGEARIDIPANGYEARITPTGSTTITMRTLDSLYADGTLPKADFIKIDCEGYEPQILLGAQAYLTASEPLGVDTETNFNTSPTLPRSHFVEMFLALNRHGLYVADLRYDGATRGSRLPWPGTCDMLFVRKFDQVSPSRLLKMIAMCDVFDLSALGTEILDRHRDLLPSSIDYKTLRNALAPSLIDRSFRAIEGSLPHFGLGLWRAIRSR